MHLWKPYRETSLPILWNATKGTLALCGTATIAGIISAKHGWIALPLYAGAIWGWYFLEKTGRRFLSVFVAEFKKMESENV